MVRGVGSSTVTWSSVKEAEVLAIYFLVEEKPLLTLVPASYANTTWSPSWRDVTSVTLRYTSAWIAITLARASRRRESFFILFSLCRDSGVASPILLVLCRVSRVVRPTYCFIEDALRLRTMKNTYPAASSRSGRTASPRGLS